MEDRTKPNFLIVGAAKAGTTAIAKHLGTHPEVFISDIKEPRYFVHDVLDDMSRTDPLYDHIMQNSVLNWSDYLDLFQGIDPVVSRVGEASVHYLYHHDTVIPKVKESLGDIPIIIVLRDPVSRAYSNYTFLTSVDTSSFERSLLKEEERKENGYNSFWFHKRLGNYYKQVDAYLSAFSNVHVCLYDDFQKKPEEFMRDIYSFLKIDDSFVLDYTKRYNETTVTNRLHYWIQKYGLHADFLPDSLKRTLKKYLLERKKSAIPTKTKISLNEYFKADIEKLEILINKDLSRWYENSVR